MNKPYIVLMISIIAVSFSAVLIKLCEAPSLSIAFYRLLFTTLLLIPFIILKPDIIKEIKDIPRSDILIMIIIGVILSFHFSLWITSLEYTSIASSVILVTAHPILVAPVAHIFYKEYLSLKNLIGISISILGVIILVSGNYTLTEGSFFGNILAFLGGLAAGLYILGGRRMRRTISITSYAFVVYASGAIMMFVICLLSNSPLLHLRNEDYLIILIMAFVSGILGHTLYNWSLAYIRASVASVSLLGEPIGSSILAYIIPSIKQEPTIFTIIGGGIILLGIHLTTKEKEYIEKRS
ncbi:MAG: DMT family transporter [Candidatus Thermoplasmatota archaeon]